MNQVSLGALLDNDEATGMDEVSLGALLDNVLGVQHARLLPVPGG
jgi:hypothetical protein